MPNSEPRLVGFTAMNQMQGLTFHGDAGKWKLEFLSSAREIYASKLTIEHFIMHCAFKSFEGKNTQVQGMMAQDINSPSVILPGMSLDALASKYSSFVATMTVGKKDETISNDNKDEKCNYCGKKAVSYTHLTLPTIAKV